MWALSRLAPNDLLLIALVSACAITDVRRGKIFNAVTYPAIVIGLAMAIGGWGSSVQSATLGFLVGGVSLYVFFAFGWMGGGDVKLMAAVGAIRGYPFILNAMFYSIFLAGTGAALILIWRGQTSAVFGDLVAVIRRVFGLSAMPLDSIPPRGGSFPFGAAIAVGTVTALLLETFQP